MTSGSTPLDHAILGLLHKEPRSGYALRKVFAETPLSHYSDSPGAIYPALARLRRMGLVTATVQNRQSLRPRQEFRLSSAGLKALHEWVSAPVTREELTGAGEAIMLRFVFAEQALGAAAAVAFLRSYERALAAYVPELEAYCAAAAGSMPLGARLALQGGVASHRGRLKWVREAIREFRGAPHERKAG
ncbi:MAG: PadR family transcriptional regulator [Vicinamibacterales bacterium]